MGVFEFISTILPQLFFNETLFPPDCCVEKSLKQQNENIRFFVLPPPQALSILTIINHITFAGERIIALIM